MVVFLQCAAALLSRHNLRVASQVVILAREAGLELELEDVPVASLVPKALQSGTPAEFIEQLSNFDSEIAEKAKAAAVKVRPD
jgi:bifunctional aspartokinase / homoserine dehydrogenase 1